MAEYVVSEAPELTWLGRGRVVAKGQTWQGDLTAEEAASAKANGATVVAVADAQTIAADKAKLAADKAKLAQDTGEAS